jgi:hypothetical protein
VTVTYTDTAVRLPAGAAAKASVQIAGDEPLVAQRRIELPEAFLRADRERQTNRMIIGGVFGLLLLGGIFAGAIVVTRRRAVIEDGILDRRKTLILVGAITALAVVDGLSGLPSTLSSYDTSEPWSRFIGSTAVGFVGAPATALLVVGVLVALDVLRRRVGVPMLRDAETGTATRDMLVAGLGLGAMIFAMVRLESLVPLSSVARSPPVPDTLLDRALPWLGDVPSVPAIAIMTVAVAGIPILVLMGITRRWALRALIAAVALALVAAVAIAFAPPGEADPVRATLVVVRVVVIALALYYWGTLSAWSWVAAALVFSALGGLRSAVYASTGQEQVAGALMVLAGSMLIALIVRHALVTDPDQPAKRAIL